MEEESKQRQESGDCGRLGIRLGSETDDGGAETFDYYPGSGRNFVMKVSNEHESPNTTQHKSLQRDFSFAIRQEADPNELLVDIDESKNINIMSQELIEPDELLKKRSPILKKQETRKMMIKLHSDDANLLKRSDTEIQSPYFSPNQSENGDSPALQRTGSSNLNEFKGLPGLQKTTSRSQQNLKGIREVGAESQSSFTESKSGLNTPSSGSKSKNGESVNLSDIPSALRGKQSSASPILVKESSLREVKDQDERRSSGAPGLPSLGKRLSMTINRLPTRFLTQQRTNTDLNKVMVQVDKVSDVTSDAVSEVKLADLKQEKVNSDSTRGRDRALLNSNHLKMLSAGNMAQREILLKSTFNFGAFNLGRNDRALSITNDGRPRRWALKLDQKENFHRTPTCCNSDIKDEDYVVVRALEQFNKQLYDDLERRKLAIKNWNKLKIILIVFKLFSGKVLENTIKHQRQLSLENSVKYRPTIDEALVQYIFLPTSKYIIPWSTFTAVLYIISFYNDCITMSLGLYTLLIPWRKTLQSIMSLVTIIDSILYFITAYRKESNQSLQKQKANKEAEDFDKTGKSKLNKSNKVKKKEQQIEMQGIQQAFAQQKARIAALGQKRIEKLNHTLYETKFKSIASRYLRTYFFFDILGCAPILMYEGTFGWTTDYDKVLEYHINSPFYHFVFWLKLFKFMAVASRINDTYNLLFSLLKDKFYQNRPQISNLQRLIKVVMKTAMGVHIFVCVWVLIFLRQSGRDVALPADPSIDSVNEFLSAIFVDQTYFVVTTVTTIGYGDIRPHTHWERLYIMFVQFFGIMIFSEYKVAITTFESSKTVESMVASTGASVQNYLYELSQLRKGQKVLPDEIYDDALLYIEEAIRYSTRVSFKNFPFWKILPPHQRIALVQNVLQSHINQIKFFFEDVTDYQRAPPNFITQVMVALDCTIYEEGDVIVRKGDHLEEIHFIIKGSSVVIGTHKKPDGEEVRLNVVQLREGSWFGDYNILFKLKSTFELVAKRFNGKSITKLANDKIQIFSLNAIKFLKICDEYPEFRRYCMMRANMRRAHFRQVYEENLHYYLLNRKLLARHDQKQFEIKHGLYRTRKQQLSEQGSNKHLLNKIIEESKEEEKNSLDAEESEESFDMKDADEEQKLQKKEEDTFQKKLSRKIAHRRASLKKSLSGLMDRMQDKPSNDVEKSREFNDSSDEEDYIYNNPYLTGDEKLKIDARKSIMREFRDFKMSARKHADPLELKSRVHLLSNGFMEIIPEEKDVLTHIQDVAEKRFELDRYQTYSQLLFKIQASYKIIHRTNEQWTIFNKDSWQWLGAVTRRVPGQTKLNDYSILQELGLKICIRSVQAVAWTRTQQLHKIKFLNCCQDQDMKERIEIKKYIKRMNLETSSLEELENAVIAHIKALGDKDTEIGVRKMFIESLQLFAN